ncbi:MAG TPA: ATP-binding cassette domain-containing protein, partial [Chthonomonadales bacterium]|nr:ATP-binding cassette domain-containing protein [Chthonomonadales bacterium]
MESNTPYTAGGDVPDAIRMEGITKRYPGVVANNNVSLQVRRGALHAVIGENGAGKSTLLNILYGAVEPDFGSIRLNGKVVRFAGPADAIGQGIGLVSQHSALIPALSVRENIALGKEPAGRFGVLHSGEAVPRIRTLVSSLSVPDFDLDARAARLSVAARQKVEIVKALYHGATTLLLDEPTASLAPQEADSLFRLLQDLRKNNATIVLVTHKLREVLSQSTSVTV